MSLYLYPQRVVETRSQFHPDILHFKTVYNLRDVLYEFFYGPTRDPYTCALIFVLCETFAGC